MLSYVSISSMMFHCQIGRRIWTINQKMVKAREMMTSYLVAGLNLGKEIVTRCRGHALLIKMARGMMAVKDDSVYTWRKISNHLKGELVTHKKDELVFSTLHLSYQDLPA